MPPLMTDVCVRVCVLEELTGSFNVEGCAAGFTCAGQPAADLRAAARLQVCSGAGVTC